MDPPVDQSNDDPIIKKLPYCDVEKDIEDWLKTQYVTKPSNAEAKNFISLVESKRKKYPSAIEISFIKRVYTEIVLKTWLGHSLENVLKNEMTDDIPTLIRDLNSLQSFQDLKSDQPLVFQWCKEYLDLILDQKDLFEDGPFPDLVYNYFKEFKTVCVDQLRFQAFSGISLKGSEFISTLVKFLNHFNSHCSRQTILENELIKRQLEENKIDDGKRLIESLADQFSGNETEPKDDWQMECIGIKKSIKDLEESEDWTNLLRSQINECCTKFLLPLITYKKDVDGGRSNLIVQGSVIRISQIQSEMQRKMTELKVEQVKIVGLISVYIDSNLEQKIWHGRNVIVTTTKLFVDDKAVTWNLSGLDGSNCSIKPKNGHQFDGLAGEHGKPGESGGNVHVVCDEIINPGKWTIISNGGKGNCGQNGSDGQSVVESSKDTEYDDNKPTKDQFQHLFGDLTIKKMTRAFNYLKDLKTPISQVTIEDIDTGLARDKSEPETKLNYFFQKLSLANGQVSTITASCYKDCSFVLWEGQKGEMKMGGKGGEGGKGGQGGYGGTITIQKRINQDMSLLPGPQVDVVSTVSLHGESGLDGENGKGGRCGLARKSTGDVGYIDNLAENSPEWKKGKIYFGFDTHQHFEIQYHEEMPSEKLAYTRCKWDENTKNFAVLNCIDDWQDNQKEQNHITSTKGRQQQALEEAVRNKAITYQSLVQHLNQIDELNRTIMEKRQSMSNIDEIVRLAAKKRQTLLINLSSSSQVRYLNETHQNDSVLALYRKSTYSQDLLNNDGKKIRQTDDTPDPFCWNNQSPMNEDNVKKMEDLSKKSYPENFPANEYLENCLQQVSHYLEPKSTEHDENSILHAVLGQKDRLSDKYKCDNIQQKIESIKAIVTKSQNTVDSKTIRDFVMQLSDDDKDFKQAQQIRENYFRHIKTGMWEHIENMKKKLNPIAKDIKFSTPSWEIPDEIEHKINHLLKCCLNKKFSHLKKEDYVKHKKDLDGITAKLNKGFDWQKQFEGCENEYKRFIQSKPLGLSQLRQMVKGQSIIITAVHENVGPRSQIIKHSDDHHISEVGELTFKCDKKSFDISKTTNYIILLNKGKGLWQRLEINSLMQNYCKERILQIAKFRHNYNTASDQSNLLDQLSTRRPIFAPTSLDLEAYRDLINWVKDKQTKEESNCCWMNQVATCARILNPEFGSTPSELSRILLKSLKEHDRMDEELAKDVVWLTQRIVDYDSRNVDPIFYLSIVANLSSHGWKYEFLLLEMEECMQVVLGLKERNEWRRNLYKLNDYFLPVLQERLSTARESSLSPKLDQEKMGKTLEILVDQQISWTIQDVDRLKQLALNDWFYELEMKMMQKEINQLSKGQAEATEQDVKEAVCILMELRNKRGEEFVQELIKSTDIKNWKWPDIFKNLKQSLNFDDGYSLTDSNQERTLETIINLIQKQKDNNTSTSIVNKMKTIQTSLENITKLISDKKFTSMPQRVKSNHIEEAKIQLTVLKQKFQTKQTDKKKKQSQQQVYPKDCKMENIKHFLYTYICAVQLKMGFWLSNAQRVTIMALLMDDTKILAQVSTGEGKSLIVAAISIYRVLFFDEKVDVITSNKVLAERDSSLTTDQGGLKDLYQLFQVDVAHNCSSDQQNRIKAYDSAVVYGELANFQRDYLLGFYYNENIRGNRNFEYVVVDEVDCMLLDRGNNILFLTHDIPGMETLESLYVFIWEKIRDSTDRLDLIKSTVLFDLYGTITINYLEHVCQDLKNQSEKKRLLWSFLINKEIIDQSGRLITNDDIEITQSKINSINYLEDPSLNPKLKFFFQNVLERERFIRIPQHLLSFVDRHLDTFLENAMKALMLNADEHYVVDHNRSSGRNYTSPQVIIIDPDTGTDLSTSQWDGGLHQFLQLKEGCQLTVQSLKSVFISNLSYITKYKCLSGLTGTLGSKPERDFLNEKYQCDYLTVPTAFQKKMTITQANVTKTQDSWLTAILNETEEIVNKDRSLIIFCRSIKEVKDVYQHLKSRNESLKAIKIECYTRDYDIFPYGSKKKPLDTRQVIVATNLAGRGTDIKLSQSLSQNGGLHICLTYLPGNIRIEEQAMGRAARQGDPGSGKLILCQPDDDGIRTAQEDWPEGKLFDLKGERERQETLRISKLRQDFERIAKQEQTFNSFWELYKPQQTKQSNFEKLTTNSIRYSLLDQWALWLDQADERHTFDKDNNYQIKKKVTEFFNKLIESKTEMEWVTPGRLIKLAKQLIERAEKKDLELAVKLLDKLTKSKDSFLYPAAYYYRVLIYKKDGVNQKNQNQFILTLRTAQTILEQHINIQETFSLLVNHLRGKAEGKYNSLYFVEGYREQKENVVLILSHYINSIRSLLGSHCSVFDLQQVGIDDKKAQDYYDHLVKAGCIFKCRVNDQNTVPNRDKTLKEITIRYGIKLEGLEKFLQQISNLKSQEEMRIKLENSGLIRYTRRKVWDFLVYQGVLFKPTSDQPDSSIYDTILYDPTPENIKHLTTERNKFCQSCLGQDVEWARIRMPYDTKTKVDLTALFPAANDQQSFVLAPDSKPMDIKTVDLTCFGTLSSPDDLIRANITDAEERESVWVELKKQILTQDGGLRSDYQAGMAFDYPKCPVYQDAVMRLVEKTYLVELVRRQWLVKEQDPIRRMQWIAYIPIDPYQDLLDDLQTAHFISVNQLTDDKEINLEKQIEEITQCQDERVRILNLLRNCQADYVTGCKFFLAPIGSDIQTTTEDNNTIDGIGAELYTFDLVGFNNVIRLSDKIRLRKLIKRNSFNIIASLVTMGTGIGILAIPDPTGLLGILASELVVRGVRRTTKILRSILSHYKDLPWTCHLRRLLKDPMIYSESLLHTAILRIKNRGRPRVHIDSSNTNRNTTEDQMTIVIDTMMKPQRGIDIGMTIAWQRLDGQTEYLLREKLGLYFHQLALEISRKIKTIVTEETIETIVDGNQETDWVDSTQPWFNNLVTSIASITFDHNKEQSSAEEQSNEIYKEIKKVLDTFKVSDVLVHLIENQIKCLSDDKLDNVTSQMKEKAEKMIELLKKSVLQEAVKHVDHPNVNRLQELGKERRSQWNEKRVNVRIPLDLSTVHIQTCLKLMKKTKDPSLLAALLRETDGSKIVANDSFCMVGINKALEQVKDELLTKEELPSQKEKLADKIDDDPSFSKAIRSGWRIYTEQTCPFQLFPVDDIGCTNTDCQLRGLNDYIGFRRFVKKEFQGESEADSFDNMRKHLINRRDYQSLIWLNIQTFVLPIATRLSYNDLQREELVKAAEEHYAPKPIENGESSNVISKKEADELTKRFRYYI